jgi:uridine monophosphate synthetase
VKNMSFLEKLESAIEQNKSLLCLGLDPEILKFDKAFAPYESEEQRILQWCLEMVEKTKNQICCIKPNIAFFEQYGSRGIEILIQVIQAVPKHLPILLDIKRGDIGNTVAAYARAAFEVFKVDAVTVNPYLGRDGILPFLEYPGKMVFVLCQTSNPSADEVQQHGTPALYKHVASIAQTWGGVDQIGFVVGATKPEALTAVRIIAPNSWILAPGVGAQGGVLETTINIGLRDDCKGLIIPVSRSVIYADDAGSAAAGFKNQIEAIRKTMKKTEVKANPEKTLLALALEEAKCIKFGNFTLSSGKQSPVYIDLRRMISFPDLFRMALEAYQGKVKTLTFDRIAAVPYAALPIATGISLLNNQPMIYPRKEVKQHGTGQSVEGDFSEGQTVALVEDVITSGGSILTAVETLKGSGLVVKDVLVLVDRQQGGRELLKKSNIELHTIFTIRELLEILSTNGKLDKQKYEDVKAYLKSDHG